MPLHMDVTLKDIIVGFVCAIIVAPFLPILLRPVRAVAGLPMRGLGWFTKKLMALGHLHAQIAADPVRTAGYCTYVLATMLLWLTMGSTFLGATAVLWLADVPGLPLIILGAIGGGCWLNVAASFSTISIFYIKYVVPQDG